MFGLIEYALAGVAAAGIAWGGYNAIQANRANTKLEQALHQVAVTEGQLANCSARLQNIQEAEASNAEIPDDLLDFTIPDSWRVQPERASAGPH